MENIEKAIELLKKEDFVKKFAECDDTNAAIALFAQNGANVTAEDLKALGTLLKAAHDNDGEIPDEIAEQVAGGIDLMGAVAKSFEVSAILNDLFQFLKSPLERIFKLFGMNMNMDGGNSSGS